MATHSEKANLYPTHKCSFCGKTNNDVASIIAGDGVCICDECVFVCVKILFKKDRIARNGEKNIKA
ncbi:hypothetical protein K3U18_003238 [Salmonella enterica]|nr:hypothetical protein [Salmonella enterica subsp. enterica]EBN8270439.1 hypothetical protein [Salmonella enterica]ECC9711724.1 hypothetical protein [Salmonella enterica subsp. enterica]ECH8937274.1 hypothetical protein [Salmonella enterica subsp. enterica]ECV2872420.1 hypothetical protein [Salmonella enterica]